MSDVASMAATYYTDVSDAGKILLTPVIGISGSFILGSATMSNLLLNAAVRSSLISEVGTSLLLALLNSGSSIGNAVSFQNIILVKSVVGHSVSETSILRYTILVVGLFLLHIVSAALVILMFI